MPAVSKSADSGDDSSSDSTAVYSSIGLTISQIANLFLRRDGGNKVSGDIDMSGNKLLNVADPVGAGDAANMQYADLKITKTGDEMTGNLMLKLLRKNSISLGCSDLRDGKRFNILLGNTHNIL
jgi:hypothetical protein